MTLRTRSRTESSDVIEILRSLQERNKTKPCVPQRGDRIGFSFSTRDRFLFTLQSLQSLDAEGGFDLIWNDGSADASVPALARNYKFRKANLVEMNFGVTGGPEHATCLGLSRLLELGYDYVGLIGNDILFKPGWFSHLMRLFALGAADGIACGSVTARAFESNVLEYRSGYGIYAGTGAGMNLFPRAAAEIIVELHRNPESLRTTTHTWQQFYADVFGLDLRTFAPFWAYPPEKAFPLALDCGYTPSLYLNGYASLCTIPSYVTDLEFDLESFFHTKYVTEEKNETGINYPTIAAQENTGRDPFSKRRAATQKPSG